MTRVAGTAIARSKTATPVYESPEQLADRDRLVMEHLGLVKTIASRMRGSLPSFVDSDDLVQAGSLGLMDAARKFSPGKGIPFQTYAKHRIRGAILDSLRENDGASRDLRRWQKRIETVIAELSAKLHRAPEETEIAQHLDVDVDTLRGIRMRTRGLEPPAPLSRKDEDLSDLDFPTSSVTYPDSICATKQLNDVLGDAVKQLSPRHQRVLQLYYAGGMTMREIGNRLGVNESRVSQVHKVAISHLEQRLRTHNVTSSAAL